MLKIVWSFVIKNVHYILLDCSYLFLIVCVKSNLIKMQHFTIISLFVRAIRTKIIKILHDCGIFFALIACII